MDLLTYGILKKEIEENKIPEEQINQIVAGYMNEHPPIVEVDSTLTVEGKAADAAAAGKAIDELKKYVDDSVGNVPDEKITEAVNTYLEENPVAPGATSEQAEQIQDNTNKITELKGEIADKATLENGVVKFWKASTEESRTDTLLYSVDISSIGGTGGLDLENLTLSVSQVGNYQRLSMSDGTTTKNVDIPITTITDEQVQNAVNNYMAANPIDETDPTVPDWAKNPTKPTYTASEVGALPDTTKIPSKTSDLQNDSGFLTQHQDLSGYALKSEIPKVPSDIGAESEGTAESKVSAHNVSDIAHNDIRLLVQGLTERLNALVDSDDPTLDQMSEVVAYIKSNKSLIDAITTNKVSVSDIVDNLTTNVANKPLSAAQGVALKKLIDAIVVPTKLSQFTNDTGFITGITVDSELSETSENPAQNKVVKAAVDSLKGDLNDKFEHIQSDQLFNTDEFLIGKFLETQYGVSTPEDLTDDDIWVTTNIITKEKGKSITYATNITASGITALGYVKNSDGNYVRSDYYPKVTSGENYNTLTFYKDTELIRISILKSQYDAINQNLNGIYLCEETKWSADLSREYINETHLTNTKVKEEDIITENPINYNGNEVNVFFYGIACGDSLTEGTFNTESGYENHKQYAYPMIFTKKTGVTLRNFGVGGSTAKSWYERYQNVEFPIYDFAIISFGVNDLLQGVSPSETTTYINNIVDKLKANNSGVKCFVATVNKAYISSNSHTESDWNTMNEAIRNFVSTNSNCYLLDIARYGLTEQNTPYVNGHLTAIGYNELAREFANLISWNIQNNMSDFVDIQFSGTTYTSLPTD